MNIKLHRVLAVCAATALAVVLLAGFALTAGCGGGGLSTVQLDSGPVLGTHEEVDGQSLWVFKGIPYAAPPVGPLRWRPPQPVKAWQEPRHCTEYGPACPQPSMLEGFSLSVGVMDEDCLYLNVWTPAESSEGSLPVMVWIHGGSLETGSGSMGVYDGRHLAAKGVVVVSINYRLGPLGFLSHPALSPEAESGVSGNYGLMDQVAALEWVQTNIGGFGGDPDKVTVFGESAGAISILDLIVSPPAEGLFRRAIVQSGVLMDQGFGATMAAGRQEAELAGEAFVARLGVDPVGDVAAQMRAQTVGELLAAASAVSAEVEDVRRILYWKPVVDGYLLPDLPTVLWASGSHPPVSLLIGSNADEADLFLPGLVMTDDEYEHLVQEILGVYAGEALELYPVDGQGGATQALGRMLTEVGFASTARFAARQMGASGADIYLYEFARAPLPLLMGAFHAAELPYVFGTIDLFSWLGIISRADRELSDAIMGYWTRFAATGDPNGGSAPLWPRYQEDSDLHLRLDTTIRTGEGLYREACDLADRVRSLR